MCILGLANNNESVRDGRFSSRDDLARIECLE